MGLMARTCPKEADQAGPVAPSCLTDRCTRRGPPRNNCDERRAGRWLDDRGGDFHACVVTRSPESVTALIGVARFTWAFGDFYRPDLARPGESLEENLSGFVSGL